MVVRVKKIYKGYVSVRDYIVKEAIENGEDLVIRYGRQTMVVNPRKGILSSGEFKSKYGGRKYSLIDFKWKPQEVKQRRLI